MNTYRSTATNPKPRRWLGIERNTDMNCPRPEYTFFRSEASAKKWADSHEPVFAFPAAADPELPGTQQNFHRRVRDIYPCPAGFRMPSEREVDKRARESARQGYYQAYSRIKESMIDERLDQ